MCKQYKNTLELKAIYYIKLTFFSIQWNVFSNNYLHTDIK